MNFVSLIAPIFVAPGPEVGSNHDEAASDNQQAVEFGDLLALIGAIKGDIAPENDTNSKPHSDTPFDARKSSVAKAPVAAPDADEVNEPPLGVIAVTLIAASADQSQTKVASTQNASIALPSDAKVPAHIPQSSELIPRTGPEGDAAADPSADSQSNNIPKKREDAPLTARPERVASGVDANAKSPAPPAMPPETQGASATVIGDTPQSSGNFHSPSHGVAQAHPSNLPPAPPSVVPYSLLPRNIELSHTQTDRAFVILSTKQSADGSFELRLDPPDLGSVRISLSPDDDGAIRALVTADRTETLDIVRRHIEVFRIEAGNHGLGNLEFRFESGPQSKNSADAERKRNSARVTDAFSAGFDGDAIFSTPIESGAMDFFA